MQNREQAIGYIIYALLKWGVSVVEINRIQEELLVSIPDHERIDNYTNTRYLEESSREVIHHYAPHHFNEDGEKRSISSMIGWAYNDYTVEQAGELFENFNKLVNGPMNFRLYF